MSAFGCLLVPSVECPAEFIVAPSEEDREVVLSERKHLFPDPLAAAAALPTGMLGGIYSSFPSTRRFEAM